MSSFRFREDGLFTHVQGTRVLQVDKKSNEFKLWDLDDCVFIGRWDAGDEFAGLVSSWLTGAALNVDALAPWRITL